MGETLKVETESRNDMVDITPMIREEIGKTDVDEGLCVVYVPHTTAGITINEGADPAVCEDIMTKLSELVPPSDRYRHGEGNADSHIKASIVGSSVTLLVEKGRPVLGTWQKIFFCEFDGPRLRKVHLRVQ